MLLVLPSNIFAKDIDFRTDFSLKYGIVLSELFKEIYGNSLIFYSGSGTVFYKRLGLRIGMDFAQNRGKMTFSQEDVKFAIRTIFLGLRFRVIDSKWYSPYVGGGIDYNRYQEDVPDRFDDYDSTDVSYHLEGGTYLNIGRHIFVDANLCYKPLAIQPEGKKIALMKFRAGVGLGLRF